MKTPQAYILGAQDALRAYAVNRGGSRSDA